MKHNLDCSETQRYRWMVFARCLLAIIAGFTIATLTVPTVAYLLPESLAMATYTGMLLSFIVWLCYILYVFSAKHLKSIVKVTLIIVLILAAIVILFKMVGAS